METTKNIQKSDVDVHSVSNDNQLISKLTLDELEKIYNFSIDMLGVAGFDGYFKSLNPAWERVLGFTNEELMAKPFIEFVHPEDQATTLAEANKLTQGVTSLLFQNRYLCKDGSFRWVAWNSRPVPEENSIYFAARDITQIREIEEALAKARTDTTRILDTISDAFFSLDTNWNFVFVNQEAERVLFKTAEEMLGNNVWELFPEAVGSSFYHEYHKALAENTPVTFQEFYPPLNTWFSVRAFPSEAGLSIYFQDITLQKETETNLQEMNNSLERRVEERTSELVRLQRRAETLAEINAALSQASNEDEILAAVAILAESYGVATSTLFYYDLNADNYPYLSHLMAARSGDGQILPLSIFPSTVLHTREYPIVKLAVDNPNAPLFIEDTFSDPRTEEGNTREFVKQARLNANISIPLKVGSSLVGSLSFAWLEVKEFGEEIQFLFNAIRPTASSVVATRRAYLAEEKARREAEEAKYETDILYTSSNNLARSLSNADQLEAMSDYARSRGASGASLYYIDTDQMGLPIWATIVANWQVHEGQSAPIGTQIFLEKFPSTRVWISRPNEPTLIEDISNTDLVDETARQELLSSLSIRGLVVLPLLVQGQWVGVVTFHWDQPYQVAPRDPYIFTVISQQAAPAVASIRSLQETERQRRQAETLAQVNAALSQANDEDEILAAVAVLAETYGVATSTLVYYDVDEKNYPHLSHIVAVRTGDGKKMPLQFLPSTTLRTDDYPIVKLVADNPDIPLFVEDAFNDPRTETGSTRAFLQQSGLNASISVPMKVGDRLIGSLSFAWLNEQQFSNEVRQLFNTLRATASSVVATRRAYLAEEQARKESEERARELETVSKVSAVAVQVLDQEQLLQTVVNLTQTNFQLLGVHFYLLDETQQYLTLKASTIATLLENEARVYVQRDSSIVALCARRREGVIVNDVSERTAPSTLPIEGICSEMSVPMIVAGKLIGILYIQSEQSNRFSSNVLLVMSVLADQIAVAVQNVRLFAEQLRVSEELRSLDKLKSQFLANMSHELRTPLNAILNFTHFVQSGIFGPVNEKQVETLNKVGISGTHLLALINDILDLSKIEAGMMSLFIEEIDLNVLLDEIMTTVRGLPKSENVVTEVNIEANLPQITGDKRRIRQILLNLLSNAYKFTSTGSIVISAQATETEIMFVVKDTGIGIAPEDQLLIFEPFKQTEVGVSKGGTGLGLPISKRLAEAHGGNLWLDSEVGIGSTFYVTLPIEAVAENEITQA